MRKIMFVLYYFYAIYISLISILWLHFLMVGVITLEVIKNYFVKNYFKLMTLMIKCKGLIVRGLSFWANICSYSSLMNTTLISFSYQVD